MSGRVPGAATCTNVRLDGRDCDLVVEPDAPVSMCQKHLREAYLYVADKLESRIAAVRAEGRERSAANKAAAELAASEASSVVYYLRFGDRIKIGTSRNLPARLDVVPHDAVLATEPGDHRLERRRHKEFAADRLYREWFAASERLVAHCAMLRQHHGEPTVAGIVATVSGAGASSDA